MLFFLSLVRFHDSLVAVDVEHIQNLVPREVLGKELGVESGRHENEFKLTLNLGTHVLLELAQDVL